MAQKIKIPSSLAHICEVEHFLNYVFKEYGLIRKIYCRMYLALTEAVNNAIIHGNCKDQSKSVTIKFDETFDQYIVSIKDEGEGFNYRKVPDPRNPSNIHKESGRGIFIMKQYADIVIFKQNGSFVKLIFNK